MDEVVVRLGTKIAESRLSFSEAATEIGVTLKTLRRHLDGEYVRSDSAAKYRRWIAGSTRRVPAAARDLPPTEDRADDLEAVLQDAAAPRGADPVRVVDLFSGCGGLSLGLDLVAEGTVFDTVLAVDIEHAMLSVLDRNREQRGRVGVGRRVDLSDLTCEAEALAFYLDHLSSTGQAPPEMVAAFEGLPGGSLRTFKASISELDSTVTSAVDAIRRTPDFKAALRSVSSECLKQTSVLSFHNSLRLPVPGNKQFEPPVVWWATQFAAENGVLLEPPRSVVMAARCRLSAEWDTAVEVLRQKTKGVGSGQLASSAGRIAAFVRLVDEGAYRELREAWLAWRSQRDALRTHFFDRALPALRELYSPVSAEVLLGGPPCQGFSRIGRGKIRSLRESGVQAHTDDEAGDERNRLLFAYVLMVSALRPKIFLFENVRHFQAEVRAEASVFRADEVLAETIQDLSDGGVGYGVHSRVLRAAEHGVPQTRERFFMAGVRDDPCLPAPAGQLAAWVLRLPVLDEVPLVAALEGLPAPAKSGTGALVPVHVAGDTSGQDATSRFVRWVRQPLLGRTPETVDAHVARQPRDDDAAWFAMMGPGKRWMDYRVDRSTSLASLRDIFTRVVAAVENDPDLAEQLDLDHVRARALLNRLDGSYALRMLLECIEPEEGELAHHLLTPNYLAKREGHHGDWLARLPADRPCKTITSHMGKDTYSYVHPFEARTLSVREAARVQSFPDWFSFGMVSLVDAFRIVGNAVPPLLSAELGERVGNVLAGWNGAAARQERPAS
jgi:DNA-cytosine methyltransferase